MVNILNGTLYIGQFLSLILSVKHFKYVSFVSELLGPYFGRKLVDIGTTQICDDVKLCERYLV